MPDKITYDVANKFPNKTLVVGWDTFADMQISYLKVT